MNIKPIISRLLKLDTKQRIKFILHFGSSATGKSTPLSDIDLAVYYDDTKEESFRFRVKANALSDKLDIHIFQDVPLTVQKEMLQGTPVFVRDHSLLYSESFRIIKEFGIFEKYYNQCIEAVYDSA